MSRLSRDIDRLLDQLEPMRRQHPVVINQLLDQGRGNDTPETFVVEADGVPVGSPREHTLKPVRREAAL